MIIPIVKPGKPANQGTSYRPISLLSPVVKILERLIKPDVVAALPKHATQHAYSPLHSTTTALLPIATQIAIGFNDKKPPRRSALAIIDISKAFDSVNHTLFIEQLCLSSLDPNYIRWLSAYLRGRTASCSYGGVMSKLYNVKSGFPQGSVLSPDLWNSFVSDCPAIAEVHSSYADDIQDLESDTDLAVLSSRLQESLDATSAWSKRKDLVIAPSKSVVTLFTPDVHQSKVRPQVSIDGVPIPLDKNPKSLGNWWDTHNTGNKQATESVIKINKQLGIMSAVKNSNWGFDKETLSLTYNSIIKPTIGFGAPIWVPNMKPSNVKKLQTLQNCGLRMITGCHLASSIDHLHAETEILPVQIHLDMLCSQFLLSAMRPAHPSHEVVLRPPGPRTNKAGRPMKETLSSKYLHTVQPYLNDNGVMSEVSYKRALQSIHSNAVSRALREQSNNVLLQRRPPAVSATKQLLPRAHRVVMRRLRSSYCSLLRDYQLRIKAVNDDICPLCHAASQNVLHLFACQAYPTSLTLLDLWKNPVDSMRFLVTLPTFRSLPPLVLLRPRPPPEPPP